MSSLKEYLLTCLTEELLEAGQESCKCIRFTTDHVDPVSKQQNVRKLEIELAQVVAVTQMLEEHCGLKIEIQPADIEEKKQRMLKYMRISTTMGTLNK